MYNKINSIFHELVYKTGDNQFLNAIKITICAVSAFVFLYNNHLGAFAFSVALGVMLTSTVDIDSSLKDKISGLSIAVIIIPMISILFTFIYKYPVLFYILFVVFVFLCSLISIYGQRANKFSFTLLLGLCLSFINISNTSDIFHNAFYMFCGGMYYMIISVLFYFLFPSRYINIEISNCIDLISKYLNLKADVWKVDADLNELRSQRLVLQIAINNSFQNINQYLEKNKMNTLNSKHNRKVVITVSFLHEIINLASTISFKDTEITHKFEKEHILESLHKIITDFSLVLNDISRSVKANSKYVSRFYLTEELASLKKQTESYNLKYPEDKAYVENIFLYVENQLEKITGLENVFLDGVEVNDLAIKVNSHKKPIIKTNNYQLKTLIDNLNFKSINFKYSLRFAIAMFFGLVIGNLIQVEKAYWILLTILVIMRPGYGLTKSRAYSRVIGTIVGGFTGVLILFFIKDTYLLSCLAIVVMIFSYWLITSDYKIGVTFLTIFIILIFGILNNNPTISFVYRIADTILGSLIALLATNYLWPSWEINSIRSSLCLAISSSDKYLDQLNELCLVNSEKSDNYYLARKNAFINSSNLMASYQRLVQEPKNKQAKRADFYEITILNQTLIGAISSLVNFLSHNKHFEMNSNFINLIKEIHLNLQHSLENCSDRQVLSPIKKNTMEALRDVNQNFILISSKANENNFILIQNQIIWIKNISEQIEKVSQRIN